MPEDTKIQDYYTPDCRQVNKRHDPNLSGLIDKKEDTPAKNDHRMTEEMATQCIRSRPWKTHWRRPGVPKRVRP